MNIPSYSILNNKQCTRNVFIIRGFYINLLRWKLYKVCHSRNLCTAGLCIVITSVKIIYSTQMNYLIYKILEFSLNTPLFIFILIKRNKKVFSIIIENPFVCKNGNGQNHMGRIKK